MKLGRIIRTEVCFLGVKLGKFICTDLSHFSRIKLRKFVIIELLHFSSVTLVRNPSETDSNKSQISSETSSEKMTAQKDAIKDTANDSQVNSCFPYRWPPASLTFNIYFYTDTVYNKTNDQ